MLDIQHLTKTYGEKKAVDDLSLRIAPGEIYGFIGHNGAGKTSCSLTRATFSSAAGPSAPTPSAASGSWPTSPITPICTIS